MWPFHKGKMQAGHWMQVGAWLAIAGLLMAPPRTGGNGALRDGAGGLMLLAAMIVAYMFPTLVARTREHPQKVGIGVLNFFLGVSGIGWVVALVWAVTTTREPIVQVHLPKPNAPALNSGAPSIAEGLSGLSAMLSNGELTPVEFEQAKREMLRTTHR